MALARWQGTLVDDAGNVLSGAQVTVRKEIAGAPIVSVYTDRDGLVPLGNPFTTDADGYAAFHVAGGAYRITATKGSFSREWRYVGIGLASELDGIGVGVGFTFATSTTDADPGAGNIRLNNATLASATTIYADNANADGVTITTWLDTFDDTGSSLNRGTLQLMNSSASGYLLAKVTGSVVDGTGYRKISITPLATFGSFTAGERLFLSFLGRGVDGGQPGIQFTFASATAMADPGNGSFRLNNATLASVTAAAFDDLSSITGNPDVSAAVLAWDDSTNTANRGSILIKDVAAPQNFALYRITGASTDNVGWTQLVLTHVTSTGSFTNGNVCSIEFVATGDAGTGSGFGAQVDLASAATTDLGTIASHNVQITGTTAITSFGSSADVNSPIYLIKFASALTVMHNATSLIIPGGANYNAAAGDAMLMEFRGSSNWIVREIFPRKGVPGVQTFLSGSGTCTPSAGIRYWKVTMCAGGGGGSAFATNNGSNGGDTSFGSWTAIHGNGGTIAGGGGVGGTGGVDGTGTRIARFAGGNGNNGIANAIGAGGGSNPFSGAGSTANSPAVAAKPNTGAGGGSAGSNTGPGGGGGAGEYVQFFVFSPTATAYVVGAAGPGGAAGTVAGAPGAAGIIIVEEYP